MKVKIFLQPVTLIIIFFLLCYSKNIYSQPIAKKDTLNGSFTYQPPFFDDTDRINRIKATFPVIEKIFKEHAERNHYPAIAFGIEADGKLIYSGALGYTDVSKKIPATSKSIFRIASMSKSFTAMAILKLRDAGKLNLDDPAYKYIPEMRTIKYLTSDAAPISIRNLLTHSAGFPEDNPWGDRQLADSDEELIKLIKEGVNFSNIPGITFEYSNLGFALLGNIVTRVSGKPYQQYISENILKPLGMTATFWEYSKVPPAQLAHGYRWINEQWREEELLHDGSYGAMGGMITSIEDFSHYMALHLSAWPPNDDADKAPIKKSSIREMHQPWRFNGLNPQFKFPNGRTCATASAYGFGLAWVKDCENKTWIGHSGGLPGFGSNWRIFEEYGIGVVSFANLTYAGTGTINLKVLDTIISLAQLKPRQLKASPILDKRKNDLLKILPDWKNVEKSGIFAENFFPDYPVDSLRKKAIELFTKAGKIVGVKELVPENNLRGSFIIEGEKINIEISFTLTPENPPLIQEYHIREVAKQ